MNTYLCVHVFDCVEQNVNVDAKYLYPEYSPYQCFVDQQHRKLLLLCLQTSASNHFQLHQIHS